MNHWWKAYAFVGALVIGGFLLVSSAIGRDIIFLVIGLSSVAAILLATHVHQPAGKDGWYLIAAGQLSWVTADALYSLYEDILDKSPLNSPADVFYLLAYPLLAAGVGILIHHRRLGLDTEGTIDSAVITVGLGLLSWVVVAAPILDEEAGVFSQLVAVSYPVGDILLLAMVVRLVAAPGSRDLPFRLLIAALLTQIAADTVFAATAVDGYARMLDLFWLSSYVLWGTAALHPSMTSLSRRATTDSKILTARRLATLMAAVLIAPVTLGTQLVLGVDHDDWAIVICSVVMFALVGVRMALAITYVTATTRERDTLQGHLSHQVAHDALTGLIDRAAMLDLVVGALHRGQRAGTPTGLLFIDLDHFKKVNDTYGHRAGDEVLREVARRMRNTVHAGDSVGRLGGDEFVVLVEAFPSEQDVTTLAATILDEIRKPIVTSTQILTMGASIGIAVSLDASTSVSQLLHEADIAAYRAKNAGRNRLEVFDDGLRRELAEQSEMEAALGIALVTGEFVLHYQPVVYLGSGAVVGYEALIRWHRPGEEPLNPDDFIPVAERSELICDIDRWVLREAVTQLVAWSEQDPDQFGEVGMGINISARHIADPEVVSDVASILQETGLQPDRLILEITETVLVDMPTAIVHLRELRELGVTISIDDFGTGYTSIGQLQRLPVNAVKIDRSFVNSTAPGARELIELMINAAHGCEMVVVAEGVERNDQLATLRELGCDLAQGFLFSHPQPSEVLDGGAHYGDLMTPGIEPTRSPSGS